MIMVRTKVPADDNKYYLKTSQGGWNTAIIDGSPKHPKLTCLANCTSYVMGRFNEYGQYNGFKYFKPFPYKNASDYFGYCKNTLHLKTGNKPKLGAIVCWSGGRTDNFGHVAIVEQLKPNGNIVISESQYGYYAFKCREVSPKENYGMKSYYKFQGFVYNPAVTTKSVLTFRKGLVKGENHPSWDYNGDGKVDLKDLLVLRKSVYGL